MDRKEKMEEILKIANNTLYFSDSSDYETALWEILATTLKTFRELPLLQLWDETSHLLLTSCSC